MKARTSGASEPRERSGAVGPRERACRGDRRGEAPRIITAALVMVGGGSSVLACPVCFGADESSMIQGTNLGVLVLLVILFAVQGGFVAFFLYLRKRAKRIADVELDTEWSELQRSPRTS